MAIVDNPTNRKTKDAQEPELDLSQLAVETEEPSTTSTAPAPDDDLPAKYRGKSPAEIARMHQELEQRFGQQGNEVGELRKALDTYVIAKLQEGTTTNKVVEEEKPDFFAEPERAVQRAIHSDPEIQRLKQVAARAEAMTLQQMLQQKHPDVQQLLNNQDFVDWVKGSKIRHKALTEADRNYDVDTLDEIFTEYKSNVQRKEAVGAETVEAEKVARKKEIKKASSGTARGSGGPAKSSSQIYRRIDIVELMKTNPRRYEALMPEIRKAYEEGRVR